MVELVPLAMIAFDGRLPQPRELGLFKDDTLIVVLPGPGGTDRYGYPAPPAIPVEGAVPRVVARPKACVA